MAKARNWILIIFAVIGVIVVCIVALAGAGIYAVTKNFKSQPATATTAVKTFEQARTQFAGQPALITLDDLDSPSIIQKKIEGLPASTSPATSMEILVWAPNSERTVRITLPFWLLKFGRKKIDISGADSFDFDRLQIDINQLERIGSKLIADIERPGGERVLVWTK